MVAVCRAAVEHSLLGSSEPLAGTSPHFLAVHHATASLATAPSVWMTLATDLFYGDPFAFPGGPFGKDLDRPQWALPGDTSLLLWLTPRSRWPRPHPMQQEAAHLSGSLAFQATVYKPACLVRSFSAAEPLSALAWTRESDRSLCP